MEAEVTGGLVRVEFDRRQLGEVRLREVLAEHGVQTSGADRDEHGGHDHGRGEHDHGGPFGERSELVFALTSAVLWTIGFVLELRSEEHTSELQSLMRISYDV